MEKFDVVVFDRYISSTKEVTRKSRSVRMSKTVEIDESFMSTINRDKFLTNYTNKENFVTVLTAKLETDITIAKVALEYRNRPVTIFANDTDISYLFLHHLYVLTDHGDIRLKNMIHIMMQKLDHATGFKDRIYT